MLDAVNHIQATQANDLACRWNCKAGKCGSCSAEVNGMPKLMCMTRMSDLPLEKPVTVQPMKAFPLIKDLIPTCRGISSEEENQAIQAATARCAGWHMADAAGGHRSSAGIPEMHRVFSVPGRLPRAARSPDARAIYRAALFNTRRRAGDASARYRRSHRGIAEAHGIGYCNITKCCTKVCPESIQITDNGIIPLKERVVDDYYDPLGWFWRWLKKKNRERVESLTNRVEQALEWLQSETRVKISSM